MRRLAVLGVAILLTACGSDSDPSNSGGGGSGSTSGGAGPGGAGGTSGSGGTSSAGTAGTSMGGAGGTAIDGPLVPASTTVGVDVESGGEDTVCFFQRLDNPDPGYIRKITGTLTPGSHHMIVYLSKRTEEELTPSKCSGFSGPDIRSGHSDLHRTKIGRSAPDADRHRHGQTGWDQSQREPDAAHRIPLLQHDGQPRDGRTVRSRST